jgi:hypothetical protein
MQDEHELVILELRPVSQEVARCLIAARSLHKVIEYLRAPSPGCHGITSLWQALYTAAVWTAVCGSAHTYLYGSMGKRDATTSLTTELLLSCTGQACQKRGHLQAILKRLGGLCELLITLRAQCLEERPLKLAREQLHKQLGLAKPLKKSAFFPLQAWSRCKGAMREECIRQDMELCRCMALSLHGSPTHCRAHHEDFSQSILCFLEDVS